jgi:hypothetical protein
VRKLDSNADLDSIKVFLTGIFSSLPLRGNQPYLGKRNHALDVETLMMWSKEFGGAVRVTEPRSVLASDPAKLLDQLFRDYVATSGFEQVPLAPQPERSPTRAQLLTAFDKSVARWRDARLITRSSATLRGRQAHHQVDRILELRTSVPVAIIEAISFGSRDLSEVYGRRATICLAAEDLRDDNGGRQVTAFALHSAAPHERLEALQESVELFRSKGVVPVLFGNVEPIRLVVAAELELQ